MSARSKPLGLSIGTAQKISLAMVSSLGPFGILSGTPLLFALGAGVMGAGVLGARDLNVVPKPKARVIAVHTASVFGLLGALWLFLRDPIDAVFLALLLGLFNRSLLRASHRDDLLNVASSSVLVAAATTVTPGPTFALLLALFVPSAVIALWTSLILGVAAKESPQKAAELARWALPSGWRRFCAMALAFTLVGFVVVLFLPRYRLSSWLAPGAFSGLAGSADTMSMRIGGVRDTRGSDLVLRLSPLAPANGSMDGVYVRLHSLDDFDGRLWRVSRVGAEGQYPTPWMSSAAPNAKRQKIIYGVEQARQQRGRHPIAAIGIEAPSMITSRSAYEQVSGTWSQHYGPPTGFSYQVDLGAPSSDPKIDPETRREADAVLLALPKDLDPRVLQLGRSLAEGRSTTKDKVRAVLGHLSRGFEYSLEALEGESEDPLARFLFDARRGHCELYAGAAAVLLRAGGVKARVATGWYQGSWNAPGGFQAFTEADAHAWTEVWSEEEGWRWIDATPADLRIPKRDRWFALLSDWNQMLNARWYDYVVEFDHERQRLWYEEWSDRYSAIRGQGAAFWDDLKTPAARGRVSSAGPLVLAPLLLLVLGGAVFLGKRRSRIEVLGLRLRRALGAERGENVTLGVLLGRVPKGTRPLAEAAVRAYETVRFGGGGDAFAARAAIRTFERSRS